jgi:hypothetical protein
MIAASVAAVILTAPTTIFFDDRATATITSQLPKDMKLFYNFETVFVPSVASTITYVSCGHGDRRLVSSN